MTTAQRQAIDDSVGEWLTRTGAPSVSIAVVTDGAVGYVHAYGNARVDPPRPATTRTRYAIDSVSKEFAASAVLLLQQDGKLSLDDTVGKYFPRLSGADTVTIRQLLSHTAGYRDYWPQDFVPPEMSHPIGLDALLAEWASRPLDFPPGTDWQYSNTGYVVAGAIVQKVSGQALTDFLQARIFGPLHMMRVTEDDTAPLQPADAGAYTRYGLGPVRPAAKEAAGWLFAASELAMDPGTLALWDISLMDRSLLKAQSYDALTTAVKLKSGKDTGYGLGLEVASQHGRRELSHDGAGSGFLAANALWPEDKVAVIALTNNDWASPAEVVDRVAFVMLKPDTAEARARDVFLGFQHGTVDRGIFTDNANAYLSQAVLADQKTGLGRLGALRLFKLKRESMRGGMQTRIWTITTATRTLTAVERSFPGGKIEQFMIAAAE
ncbi:MAG: serine hydrolase domain-containing protein [Janthinobacterium lividum]